MQKRILILAAVCSALQICASENRATENTTTNPQSTYACFIIPLPHAYNRKSTPPKRKASELPQDNVPALTISYAEKKETTLRQASDQEYIITNGKIKCSNCGTHYLRENSYLEHLFKDSNEKTGCENIQFNKEGYLKRKANMSEENRNKLHVSSHALEEKYFPKKKEWSK